MRLENQDALGRGNAQRIHNNHLALGIFGKQLLAGGINVVNGTGKLAGEGHKQDIPARLKAGLEVFQIGSRRQQRGNGGRAGAHSVEVFLLLSVAAKVVQVLLAVYDIGHVHHGHVQLVHIAVRQVGIGIGHKDIGIHAVSSLRLGQRPGLGNMKQIILYLV